MPTDRPRHYITESDELAAALDLAATRWPDDSRAKLLTRLALAGADAVARTEADLAAAVREHAGAGAGIYDADHLARERDGWPG